MSVIRIVVGVGLTISLGCMPDAGQPPAASATAPAAAEAPAPVASPTAASSPTPVASPANVATQPAAAAGLATEATSVAAPVTEPAAPATQQVTAKAGVGLQGQSLKDETGVIVEAAKAYFNVRQKAVFDIQIPSALKLYKATEGRAPQSHAEFMTKIVVANQIKLPELPPGNEYVYDPQREELMVRKPAK